MIRKSALIVAAAAIGISVAPGLGLGVAAAQGNCMPGDRIDGSTANQAASKMRAAGYSDLRDFAKGCDNYWHATGMKNGQQVGVVLSPQGTVMTESAMTGSAPAESITTTTTPMSPGYAPPPSVQSAEPRG